MGIAGFYLWLQRHYGDCVDDVTTILDETGTLNLPSSQGAPCYDNLYLDMNGLIHPCCHDTAPRPEPETEEEMFDRIFEQIDSLFNVVRPRKCLVLCIDGVAPRSKMNQQRTRRFRAADERIESNNVCNESADYIVATHGLPRPIFRERWDHNVITPSTAFMERVGQSIEWFIMKKLNEDPAWKNITVVFSDAHVPGEGEHKIMHYIRGLRAQPGYNSNTSHCIHGMDADLICLGLSTHEPNFAVLRNKLSESFQPVPNEFCYFNLKKFRRRLMEDFSNIKNMDFERVIDDFVFLCFFVGNDFLPHMPLVSIKTKGIELMLDHYVRNFEDHGYLTKKGEVKFDQVRRFLRTFVEEKMSLLKKEWDMKKRAVERAKGHMKDRVEKCREGIEAILAELKPNASESERQAASDKLLVLYSNITKEQLRFVAGRVPLEFSYSVAADRNKYYEKKFGWNSADPKFEAQIHNCCAEFFRGMQWVMRYYTKGCPSWEWFYPFHYTPLLQDLACFEGTVNVEMKISEPLHPVEQLLAVLPRQSVAALPEELHEAVDDQSSVLAKFYPKEYTTDFTEATFSYQGVAQLPFINCATLKAACAELVTLEEDFGTTLIFAHSSSRLSKEMEKLLKNAVADGLATTPISNEVLRITPIAGRVGRYHNAWPMHCKVECPDSGIAANGGAYSKEIQGNQVCCYAYELNTHADYKQHLLGKVSTQRQRSLSPGQRHDSHKKRHHEDGRAKRARSRTPPGREGRRRHRDDDTSSKKKSRHEDRDKPRDVKRYVAPRRDA